MNLSTESVHNPGENDLEHSGSPVSTPLQGSLATFETHAELVADAAEIIDTLTSNLPAEHPIRVAAAARAKQRVSELDTLAAELIGESHG